MTKGQATPIDLFGLWMRSATLAAEAGAVMSMRMMGMAGFWTLRPAEMTEMVTEKHLAFQKSAMAGATAAMSGRRPDEIAEAAMRPLARKTHSNHLRLTKSGPKWGG